MGSHSLLQRIFSTQELNWGLLHCRQIIYKLSYQGSLPRHHHGLIKPLMKEMKEEKKEEVRKVERVSVWKERREEGRKRRKLNIYLFLVNFKI